MRHRRILAGIGLVLGVLVIAGGVAALFTGGRHAAASNNVRNPTAPTTTPPTTASSLPSGGWHAVAPATTVPQDTPVQQQYDKGFEKGFASPSNEVMMRQAERLQLPAPAVEDGWPALAASNTPDGWASEFVTGLLDINFAHQSRRALGAWLVAEEGPDLMPGIPKAFQDRTLYVSLLEPGIIGQPSLLPSAAQWSADASAGLRWSVGGLQVQLEPQWQSMIDAGWQPPDIRAAVEDVSGVLTITKGKTPSSKRFSMVVQVGSAQWRDAYGTVLVSDWSES